MKYPGAIGPALRVYGRVLKTRWPMLLAVTIFLPLANWGASLGWKVFPPASGWVETGIDSIQILGWGVAWGLLGAALAKLTLATVDQRPAGPGVLLRACASALPIVALFVLATDATSLPLTLWRSNMTASGDIGAQVGLIGLLSLLSAIFDAVVLWLMVMAVPVRLDREVSLVVALKESARLARVRWKTMLLVFLLTGAGVLAMSIGWMTFIRPNIRVNGEATSWATDVYLWAAVSQAFSIAWMLFWPALYVTFRDQDGAGGVAETFA